MDLWSGPACDEIDIGARPTLRRARLPNEIGFVVFQEETYFKENDSSFVFHHNSSGKDVYDRRPSQN